MGAGADGDAGGRTIERIETRADVFKADALSPALLLRRHPDAVVGDLEGERCAAEAGADANPAALAARSKTVAHRVLDQRLKDQRRHARGAECGVARHLDAKAVAKADLLDIEIL